jgi:hypothetical protein
MSQQYTFINQSVLKWSSLYLSSYYASRYIGKQYKVDNLGETSSAAIAALHHGVVTISNLPLIKPFLKKVMNGKLADFDPNDKEYVVTKTRSDLNNSIAYLLVDLIPCLFHYKKYDWLTLFHHMVYPFLTYYVTKTGFNQMVIIGHLFEFSALFNNLQVISKTCKQNTLANIFQLLFIVSFLLTRLPLCWSEAYLAIKNPKEIEVRTKNNTKAKMNYYGLLIFTNLLNNYWGILIITKIIKKLKR